MSVLRKFPLDEWQDHPERVTHWYPLIEHRWQCKQKLIPLPWRTGCRLDRMLFRIEWMLSWGIPSTMLNWDNCTSLDPPWSGPRRPVVVESALHQIKRRRLLEDSDEEKSDDGPLDSCPSNQCWFPGRLRNTFVIPPHEFPLLRVYRTQSLKHWTRVYLVGPDSEWPFGIIHGPLVDPDPDIPRTQQHIAKIRRRLPSFLRLEYTILPHDTPAHEAWIKAEVMWRVHITNQFLEVDQLRSMPREWQQRPRGWPAPLRVDVKKRRPERPGDESIMVAYVPFEFSLGIWCWKGHAGQPPYAFRKGVICVPQRHFPKVFAAWFQHTLFSTTQDACMRDRNRLQYFSDYAFMHQIVPLWIQLHTHHPLPAPVSKRELVPFHMDTLPPCIWLLANQRRHLHYAERTAFVGFMASQCDPVTRAKLGFNVILGFMKKRAQARFSVMDFAKEWSKIAQEAKGAYGKQISYSCSSMQTQGMCAWKGKHTAAEMKEFPDPDIEDLLQPSNRRSPSDCCGHLCGGDVHTPHQVGLALVSKRFARQRVVDMALDPSN